MQSFVDFYNGPDWPGAQGWLTMAFSIAMPKDFRIGETRPCRINYRLARVTWRDAGTLVIEPGDARRIVMIRREPDQIAFLRTDADGRAPFVITAEDRQ